MNGLFSILPETCTTGFQLHVLLNPEKSVEGQIYRRKLLPRNGCDKGNRIDLIKIIEWNSSLRIAFGWNFRSQVLEDLMSDCEKYIPSFINNLVRLASDVRCDWIGFVPFNTFDREYYKDLCIEELIEFNNNLIEYQIRLVKYITEHKQYRYNLIVKDDWYRYNYFKKIRKDPAALSTSFQYYADAIVESLGTKSISRDTIEQMIGCHYLNCPGVFFELLEFNILTGTIYE